MLHCLYEGDPIVFLEESNGISMLTTPKAVKETLLLIDRERRRLFIVKWAESLEPCSRSFQPHIFPYDLDDVGPGHDFFDRGIGNERHGTAFFS